MARLIYNSIELSFVGTSDITQEPAWEESNTDIIGDRHTVTVRSVITAGQKPALAGETPTQTLARIRHHLESPRKPFYMEMGGAVLYNVSAPDVANGPKPKPLRVVRLSEGAILITFSIEFVLRECQPYEPGVPVDPKSAWVTHRWSERMRLDSTGRTVEYVRKGKITTRSDMLANPDQLRSLVIPSFPVGFKPLGAEYSLSQDNLSLDYSFPMEEVYLQPPFPAYDAEGEYSEVYANGGKREGEFWIRLRGSVGAKKADLIDLAIACLLYKVDPGIDHAPGSKLLASFALKESMYEPVIQLNARVNLLPIKDITTDQAGNKVALSKDAFSADKVASGADTSKWFVGNTNPDGTVKPKPALPFKERGTAGISLIAAILKDPCGTELNAQAPAVFVNTLTASIELPQEHTLTSGPPTSLSTPTPIKTVPVSVTTYLPTELRTTGDDGQSGFADPDPGIYDEFTATKEYYRQGYEVVLPVAKTGHPPEVVELAPPTYYCRINWTSIKTGYRPRIPDPKPPTDSGWRLLGTTSVKFADPELLADGVTYKRLVSGSYWYVIPRPEDGYVVLPIPPWMRNEIGEFIDPYRLDSSILFPDGFEQSKDLTQLFPGGEGDDTAPNIPPGGGNLDQ